MNNLEENDDSGRVTLTLNYVLAGIIILMIVTIFVNDFNLFESNEAEDDYPASTVLDVAVPLPPFKLIDQNGEVFYPFSMSRKWTFVFFGYTYCPDICPTALVDLNDVYKYLEKTVGLSDTQYVFVTVDPPRDTPEEMKEYVSHFNKSFIGLTGEPDVIASLAKLLGVAYIRVPGTDEEGDYLIDHSSSFLLIDPLVRMRAVFSPPHDPEAIAKDFIKIRDKYAAECCITPGEVTETTVFDYRKDKK